MLSKSLVQRIAVRGESLPLRGLVLATLIATFSLIIVGGIVRVTESGLGCPDWPLCNGRAIPPAEFHALIEYTHRLIATVVGVLAVAVVAITLLYYRSHRAVLAFTLGFALLLAFQIVLGGITVKAELSPRIVTAHLAIALLTVGLLTVFAAHLYRLAPAAHGGRRAPHAPEVSRWLLPSALLTAAVTFGVTMSGSYMVGAGATASCDRWPLCPGGIGPDGKYEAIALAHRMVVLVSAVLLIGTVALGWAGRRRWPLMGWTAGLLLALFIAQGLVGAANVWLDYTAAIRSAHLAMSTAVWMAAVLMAITAFRVTGTQKAS